MKRNPTSDPLVEQVVHDDGQLGEYVPAGRQRMTVDRTDGRNHYGLTNAEEVAFSFAEGRLAGRYELPTAFVTADESAALSTARVNATGALDEDYFLRAYRSLHPLPTSFSTLPAGDPALYVAPVAAPATSSDPNDKPIEKAVEKAAETTPPAIEVETYTATHQTPTILDGHAMLPVHPDIAAAVPEGATVEVSQAPSGETHVQVQHDGIVTRFIAWLKHEPAAIAAAIKAHFAQ